MYFEIFYVLDDMSSKHPTTELFLTNRKTVICRNWERSGYCQYGTECTYAHGNSELHKKKICSYFLAGVKCDDNCAFLHCDPQNVDSMLDDILKYKNIAKDMSDENRRLLNLIINYKISQDTLSDENTQLKFELDYTTQLNAHLTRQELENRRTIQTLSDRIQSLENSTKSTNYYNDMS